ncbi:MAG: hypothetical protein IJH84_08345 [Saccharopolyspora sp.]|uniref:hypothetical protein n=1 Tax=Saccharopolyspora TaxID=1835 RepID=UPI00190D7DA9|nr:MULTISPECIES: hypothetical protein [unclassified Saccharopolyspora]MBK0870074.1 hypothetical protein [Saccharopolyspora sp. HNM0986]MBQ6641029.1 hypothetical protein [Saccharopolyspora sp.]
MSAPAEHPLETLYHARDALEAAVNAVREQTTAQVSDELCCYAAVDTSILYEFRHLVSVLMTKLDTSRPAVYAAHGEMHEIINMFDQVIGYIERHQPTIAALRKTDEARWLSPKAGLPL